jgi:signal transduction histidine kinase
MGRRGILWLLLAGVLLPSFCVIGRVGSAGPVIALPAAFAIVACLVRRRPDRPWLSWALAAPAVFSLLLDFTFHGLPELVLLWGLAEGTALLALIVRVLRHVPARPAFVAGSLTGLAVVMLPLRFTLQRHTGQSPWAGWLVCASVMLLLLGCAMAIGLYLRSADLRRARAVLDARRAQRLDFARDLHDFVAHEVTGIVLEAQAAQLAAGDGGETFARIESAGLRALSSMDQTVRALREPSEDGPPTRVHGLGDLPAVAGRFSATGGAYARLEMPADLPGTVPPEIGRTAYRVVVEALTNARRHAVGATTVDIVVARSGGTLTVSVTDDGPGRGPTGGIHRESGTGLAGLGELVSAQGGRLVAGPSGPGWRVVAELPF